MKHLIHTSIISLFVTSLLLLSCDKFRARKLSGKYFCSVHYHYWDMTPLISDSSYFEEIEIEQKGNNLIVLGTAIHIDSLYKDNEYNEFYSNNHLQVLFKNDSLYLTKSIVGLGGGGSWIYAGIKK